MSGPWLVIISSTIFLILGVFFYRILKQFVKQKLGDNWLSYWGNKVYFWQSWIFMSMASTALTIGFMQWINIF